MNRIFSSVALVLLAACAAMNNQHDISQIHKEAQKAYVLGEYEQFYEILLPYAENGDRDSQFKIGMLYQLGYGVEWDYTEAAKWFHKASEQDHIKAQQALSYLYSSGNGVQENHRKAFRLIEKSAELGNASAQFDLARHYELGAGVKKDLGSALLWYEKAANNNYGLAQLSLGQFYRDGKYVEKDLVKAIEWFQKASKHKIADATYALRFICEDEPKYCD